MRGIVAVFLELERDWYPRSFEVERCPYLGSDDGCLLCCSGVLLTTKDVPGTRTMFFA